MSTEKLTKALPALLALGFAAILFGLALVFT